MFTHLLLKCLKGRDDSEDLFVDRWIILKWILGKRGWSCGLDSYGSGLGLVAGSSEHGSERSDFINGGGFLMLSLMLASQGVSSYFVT